jgi:protein-S-isoprenylcysteine O-methyltransferase Ste14
MKALDWLAALVLFLQLPIPLFWLILHSLVGFWRRHVRAAYLVAGISSWGGVGVLLYRHHDRLFRSEQAGRWAVAAALALLAAEVYLFYRVERELGASRLAGKAELSGSGELETRGIYACMRHPRYTGMMAAVAGACLLASSRLMWILAAGWWPLAFFVILLEERELRARFGPAYIEYAKRVPRFLPFRSWSRQE